MVKLKINHLIKSRCGREKYLILSEKKDFLSRIRLLWFIIFSAIRDWNIQETNQLENYDS